MLLFIIMYYLLNCVVNGIDTEPKMCLLQLNQFLWVCLSIGNGLQNVVDQNSLVKLRSGSRQTAVRHRWRNVNYRFRNFSSRFLRSRVQRAVQVVEEKSAPWGKLQFLPARKHMMSRVDIVYSWSKVRPGGSPGRSREFAIARHERGEKRSSPASTSCD